MYIPEFNRIEDQAIALSFMRANPFAILVSSLNGEPFATHLPVVVQERSGRLILRAHLAKANPHWKNLEDQQSLVIFHGPHAYISPSLYVSRESVPTWNYATVHVYGPAKLLENEADAERVLAELIAQFDSAYAAQWESLSNEYRQRMIRHIVAFEITCSRIETKFKLSQNRTRTEQGNIIQALDTSPDEAISKVAQLMRDLGLGPK